MPSNKELGFDPKWNDEQRQEWYRKNLDALRQEYERQMKEQEDKEIEDKPIDISDHPLVKIFNHHHKDHYPIYVDSDGTLDSPGLLEIADLCMSPEVEALFNKLTKEE